MVNMVNNLISGAVKTLSVGLVAYGSGSLFVSADPNSRQLNDGVRYESQLDISTIKPIKYVWASPSSYHILDSMEKVSNSIVIKYRNRKIRGAFNKFLDAVAMRESSGRYDIVSERGYLGRYQFHPTTLVELGFSIAPDYFIQSPDLQDRAFISLLNRNKKILRRVISEYNGTYYNGIYVTMSGILAGAHLAGPGGVLSFFYPEKYTYNTVDGNGVHISKYISEFSGYTIKESDLSL